MLCQSKAVPRSRWMELKVKSPFVFSPKLDMPKLPQIPRLNLPSSTLQHVDNSLPDFWSDEGNKRIHSWDGAAAGNTYETCMQPKRSQSDCVLYGGSTSQDTDGKSTSGFDLSTEFSFIRNGPYTLDHMPSELDCMASKSLPSGWHSLELSHVPSNESSFRELRRTDDNKHECALRREWCPRQLLGWGDINLGSECESDDIFRGMEMTLKPDTMQPISSGDDHQWSSNDTVRSYSPAKFPVHPFWNSTSKELISDFCLFSEVKTNIHEERDYPVEGSDHLPLILSHAQNLLSPREDHSLSDNYKWSRVFSPPPHSFRITGTFRENIYPSLDELLGFDLEFAWKSLFSNEISGEIHSLSHSSLQLCEEKEKSIFAYPNFEHTSSTGVLTNQSMQKPRLI
eukprot:TRINITY_DN5201_c0_g1_i6.p1 TRINITY_DN5201_c0_g1~~TRINITY_DN5201_c0_g1_i6.p1  ORF type:complete len:398 (-),score=67.86 TRINITY_DN5201_c0_g1_i6:317-1510(-)